MTKILGILILSSGFSASVEADNGFVERKFQNNPGGIPKFVEFSAPLAKAKDVKVCTVIVAEEERRRGPKNRPFRRSELVA
jgi:hypothetical protein